MPSPARARRSALPVLCTLVLASAAACSGGPGEQRDDGAPGLQVVSGAAQGDSAGAVLAAPLVVRLGGPDGRPVPGAEVQFVGFAAGRGPGVGFADARDGAFSFAHAGTTDRTGRATVWVRLAFVAGEAVAVVRRAGTADSVVARFTVREGRAVGVRVAPADTAVYLGRSYALRGTLVDRNGNAVAGDVAYEALDSTVTVSAAGALTGAARGRGRVVVRGAGRTDTARVSVVPVVGTFAASLPPRVVGDTFTVAVLGLDGSDRRQLASALGPVVSSYGDNFHFRPRWADGGRALVVQTAALFEAPRLWRVPVDGGAPQRVLPSGPAAGESWPSAAGPWVYYTAIPGNATPAVRRVRADGTGDEALPPALPADPNAPAETQAAASPDGTWLAWVPMTVDPRIAVRRVATGVRTALDVAGSRPAWAPDGSRLAYVAASGALSTVRPDGTDPRVVAAGGYDGAVTWSPDGAWLLATRYVTPTARQLELVEVASGWRLLLPIAPGAYEVSWRP